MRVTVRIALFACVGALVSAAAGQKVGSAAPDINTPNYFGTEDHLSLTKFKGKIIVLLFWRSTDSASTDALTALNKIHKTYGRRGVVVLALSPEDKEQVETTAKGKNVEYSYGYGGDVDKLYEVRSFPQAFLIDTRGIVVWRGHPQDDLEERLKQQIQKTPPAGSDPEALKQRYTLAQKAYGNGEITKAYTIAKDVSAVAGKEGIGDKANTLLENIDKAAKKWLEEARDAVKAEKYDEGCRKLAELSVRFAGTELGKQADDEIGRLQGDAKTKGPMRKALENARGQFKNDQAADAEGTKQYGEALAIYREVTEKYADTDAGKAAKEAVERIHGDPTVQAQIKTLRAGEEADRWLDLGDRFAKVEMYDLARDRYEQIVKAHPQTEAAKKAKQKLEKLPKKT